MSMTAAPQSSIERRQRKAVAASGAVAATLVCTLLIWAKLRLVTDIPRTAYATPPQPVAQGHAQDARDGGAQPGDPTPGTEHADHAHAAAGE